MTALSRRGVPVVTVILLALLLAGAGSASAQILVGTWEWVQTDGGFAGIHITPATEGFTIQLEFTAGGLLRRYENEALQEEAEYTLEGNLVSSGALWHSVENQQVAQIVDLGFGIQLILSDQCMDCYTSRYEPRGPVGPIPIDRSRWGAVKALFATER